MPARPDENKIQVTDDNNKAPNTSTHAQETDLRVTSGAYRGGLLWISRRPRSESTIRTLWPFYAPMAVLRPGPPRPACGVNGRGRRLHRAETNSHNTGFIYVRAKGLLDHNLPPFGFHILTDYGVHISQPPLSATTARTAPAPRGGSNPYTI